MGGGKSRIIVDYIQNIHGADPTAIILLVCPLKAAANVWPDEFTTYWHPSQPYRLLELHTGRIEDRAQRLMNAVSDGVHVPTIAMMNYEAMRTEPMTKTLHKCHPKLVVFDESHRLKGASASTSHIAGRLCKACPKIVCLTGTPMSQGPIDIYGQARSLAPGLFGHSLTQFRNAYCVMNRFIVQKIDGYKNLDSFNEKLNRICFRVGDAEIDKHLPDAHDIPIKVDLPPKILPAYMALEEDLYCNLDDDEVSADNALVKQLRLQQLAGGFLSTDAGEVKGVHTAKLDAIAELIDGIAPEEKIVVFCRFRPEIKALGNAIKAQGRTVNHLIGGLDELKAWKAEAPGAVLIAQISAGAEAVSFVEARYQIYASLCWSLTSYEQSRRRIRRQGQIRPVTYYHIIARGTVDTDIYAALRAKDNLVDKVRQGILDRRQP